MCEGTTANVKHEILTKELENRVARSMELEMQVGNLKRMASELEASVQCDRAVTATARTTHEEQVAELCKVLAATSSEFALKAEALLETRESQLQLRLVQFLYVLY